MISRKVWHALKNPPNGDPIFERTLSSFRRTVTVPVGVVGNKKKRKHEEIESPSEIFPLESEKPKNELMYPPRKVKVVRSSSSSSTLVKVLAVGVFIWFFCCSGGFILWFLFPVLLLALGTGYGLYSAVRMSGIIASERDMGMYDLLSLTPPGAVGFSWATCMGFLYRNLTYQRLRRWLRIIFIGLSILLGGLLLLSIFSTAINWQNTPAEYRNLTQSIFRQQVVALATLIFLMVGFYVDFYHSMICAVLVAIITPTYGRNRFEAQALTVAGFLGLQIVTYLATIVFGAWLLPGIYQRLYISGWIAEITQTVLWLGLFFAIREAFIRLLWNLLTQRLNTDLFEFERFAAISERELA